MSKEINKIMIAKKDTVIVESLNVKGRSKLDKEELNTLLCNLLSLGYIPSKELNDWFSQVGKKVALKVYDEIMDSLKELLGVREYKPMYPNFPTQVMEASDLELFCNAILHYYSLGEWLPFYEVTRRPVYRGKIRPKELKVSTVESFLELGRNIMQSKTSISQDDREVLEIIFDNALMMASDIPSDMPYKENKAIVWALAIKKFGVVNTGAVKKEFTTATDVLRLIVALSDGDVSLAQNTKFKSFPRAHRRLFMDMLNGLGYEKIIVDMIGYPDVWKRVAERIHTNDFKHHDDVKKAFYTLRSKGKVLKFFGKVYQLIETGEYLRAAEMLSKRPGELARKLDLLLRKSNSKAANEIAKIFDNVAVNVATPVLLQVKAHFEGRILESKQEVTRVAFPKGNTAKAFVIETKPEAISKAICNKIVETCKKALVENYSQRETMGNVYLDESIKGYLVPASQRSASGSIKPYIRGSRMAYDKTCQVIRAFVWWMNGGEGVGRVDIDLSAQMLDENFNYVGHVSYTNLRSSGGEVIHSGDITDAPNGACEFIDINIKDFLAVNKSKNVRYVALNVYSFTHQAFKDIPECSMGWMERSSMGKHGEIYDARTVKNRILLTGNAKTNIPMVIDLKNREIIWLDLGIKSNVSWTNNVEDSKDSVCTLVRGIVNSHRANLYDLIQLNVEARGNLVETKEEADIIFSLDEGVTPFDVDEFMAKYI